jgi:GT2 family glycosyltransferase
MQTQSLKHLNKTASVTVIIVNWNCMGVLGKCLDHLLNQTLLPGRVLVMDNGSSDGSVEEIAKNSLIDVRLLGANLGFAVANNRALLECDSDYVVLLNPDAFPNPDWLERLLAAANSYPDVAAFASLQLCDDNADYVDGEGDSYHISGLVWRECHGAMLTASDLKNRTIFSPCAAAALYRRQALLDVGGFDEDYFCYVEDVDLGFRLRLAGHQAMFVHDAVVRHMGSASTGGKRSDFCVYHGHRNLVWTYIKNMPGFLFWVLLPMHLLLNVVTIVYFSWAGQGKVILQAKLDALKGIPKMWRKRQMIQSRRSASIADMWRVIDKRLIPLTRNGKNS